MRHNTYIALACTCLMVLLSADSLWANDRPARTMTGVANSQVFRASDVKTFDIPEWGPAVLTGDVVYINLLIPRAVVVSYSVDMFANTGLIVGLKVNSGECAFYGPAALSSESKNQAATIRWIVNKDEVSAGTNRFEVCVITGTGSYDLRTLTVERPQ